MSDRPYSDDDIRIIFRQAKNKKAQLHILADLNCCSVDAIKEIVNYRQEEPAVINNVDWDTAFYHLDNGETPEIVAERFGTTVGMINRVRGRREAAEQKRNATAEAEAPESLGGDELARITAVLSLVRPHDHAEVKRTAALLVRELANQAAERAMRIEVEAI